MPTASEAIALFQQSLQLNESIRDVQGNLIFIAIIIFFHFSSIDNSTQTYKRDVS